MSRACQFIRDLILDIDWLEQEDGTMLREHMSRCPSCAQELELVQQFGSLLDEDASTLMPDDMTERIMAAVMSDRTPVRSPASLPLLAIVVLAQLLVFVWMRGGLAGMLGQVALLVRALSDGFLVPLFTAAADALAGLAQSAGQSWSSIPTSLWLPAAACMVVLCLCSGGILYREERTHD